MDSFPETHNDLFFPLPPPFSRSRAHIFVSLSPTRHPSSLLSESLEQASSFWQVNIFHQVLCFFLNSFLSQISQI